MSVFSQRQLGKTDLRVSPLGIGGGGGISNEDLLYAFEQGINYFFFSSDLHHHVYQHSVNALKKLCGRRSSVREKVVLATVTYVNHPQRALSAVADQIAELGIDYIDVFHWGGITDSDTMLPLLKRANQLKDGGSVAKKLREIQAEHMMEASETLLSRGLVRYVGASFHSYKMARAWMKNLDVLMLRYNICRTEAEDYIMPFLVEQKEQNPGIVVFNSMHEGTYAFDHRMNRYAQDSWLPTMTDNYRFALSQPWVDVVLTGVQNRQEVDSALAAMKKGPLSEQECALMRHYGQLHLKASFEQRALLDSAIG